MSDLVQRLRALSETGNSLALGPGQDALREAADTIEIMAREIADLKAQHLLTQAEEMHRIVVAANEPPTTPGVPLRPDPGVPHTRGGTPL